MVRWEAIVNGVLVKFNGQMITTDLFQMGHSHPRDMIHRHIKWSIKWHSSLTGGKRQRKHLEDECDYCFQAIAI